MHPTSCAKSCLKHKAPYVIDPRDVNQVVCAKCEKKIIAAFDLLGIHPVIDRKKYLEIRSAK